MSTTVAIHWFRKGLRLHDNPALQNACNGATKVYPIFILDPHFANPENVGILRYNFLLESLTDLDNQLRGKGSRLFVLRGEPVPTLERLIQEWGVTKLTFEMDTEPYAKRRDSEVRSLAEGMGVTVCSECSHTLHNPEVYLGLAKSVQPPTTYNTFLKLFAKAGSPASPLPPLDACDIPPEAGDYSPDQHCVPSLQELGYPEMTSASKFPGGETEAISRLNHFLSKRSWIANFEKPKTSPNSLEPSTTVLSPYLKFGCLSPRLFYHRLQEVYDSAPKHASPPVSLHGQLLWREFFYLCGSSVPNYDKMEGNPICKQIPWEQNEQYLKAWEEGQTGYPWIDAVMNQLRQEGWIHHLARHAVACFLTRGDLWVSWEEGAKVFEKYLLDADWSLNNANWMWLSCSSFFYQYFRCYSPVAFGKKTDPDGSYIRKYVPQLKKFPSKFIYEPWKAPKSVQEGCNCIIGQDYPTPIVDHQVISKENMSKMKQAYAANNESSPKQKSSGSSNAKKRKGKESTPEVEAKASGLSKSSLKKKKTSKKKESS
eukprot:CAMPEP_0117762888 /NCGR_PEP_ID=MMETSP0947-20121206/18262_1 /TAXON_ID=44440 /ORGANISM="Chattonella subsalsa, Strain CCMP2191" /LENGTH=540 /DNA_ID=CAMNT_0005584393 /DNA_START=199 /DNA_END=1821 /DNA_ORIENTATION=-